MVVVNFNAEVYHKKSREYKFTKYLIGLGLVADRLSVKNPPKKVKKGTQCNRKPHSAFFSPKGNIRISE